MVYSIGDRVRVRTWESMEEQFGLDDDGFIPTGDPDCPVFFSPNMRCLCGRIGAVEDFYTTGGPREGADPTQHMLLCFEEPRPDLSVWLLTQDMVEKVP